MSDNIIPSVVFHPGELAQFPLNSNSHPASQIDELIASRERFSQYRNIVGWRSPDDIEVKTADEKTITLKKGVMYVLAGNGFHQASIKRQDNAIEVKDYSHLSLDEAILLAETDNAAPLGAQRLVAQLRANYERTQGLYQDDERLKRMFERARAEAGVNGKAEAKDVKPQIDKAGELAKVWGTKLGQIWELGAHRLAVGDCTDRATVEAVMMGERANLALTDPPYGVGMEYGMHEDDPEENESLVIAAFSFCPESKIWTPGLKNLSRELIREPSAGVLAWNRKFSVGWPPHGCSWATVWEPVLVTKPLVRNLNTDHFEYMTDRFSVGDTPLSKLHPCPKALGLWEELLNGLSEPEMIVYEPFSGSGTTIIAAQNLSRKCRAIELDPGYAAVSIQRWADLTTQQPRLISG